VQSLHVEPGPLPSRSRALDARRENRVGFPLDRVPQRSRAEERLLDR